MIKSLRIQNFKGWKDTGNIKLSPITLFLGPNSSGKSSIGQFLLLLKQSVTSDRKTVLFLGNSDSVVELGGSVDMLYKGDTSNKLDFEYRWTLPKEISLNTLGNEDAPDQLSVDSIDFHGQIGLYSKEKDENQYLEVESMEYTSFYKGSEQISASLKRVSKASSARSYKAAAKPFRLIRTLGRPWELPNPYRFYGFPAEMLSYFKNAYFTPQLNAEHEQLFSTISYIGPLRERGDRQYRWTGSVPSDVGPTGKNTILALLASRTQDRMYNFKPNQPRLNFEEVVAKCLKDMGLIEQIAIGKVREDKSDYDVKVKPKGSESFSDIPDVGFGISQVLPVIVQLFYAPANSIIIMEQPELHLHPSAQAKLADVMIDAINAREDAQPRNIQLIIETHSEHFLRRFQRRIAERALSEEQFSAYFANNEKAPTVLEPLQINLYGEIINWPKNFFGDITGDVLAQAEAKFKGDR